MSKGLSSTATSPAASAAPVPPSFRSGGRSRPTPPPIRERQFNAPVFFMGIGLLIVTGVLAGASALIHSLYLQSYEEHRRELRNLSVTLASQIERTLQGLDLVQRSIADRIGEAGVVSREQLQALMGTQAAHDLMREKISGLPQVDAVTLLAADGTLVNFSRSWPPPAVNLALRDYFVGQSRPDAPVTVISEPLRSFASGAITLYLARRVTASDGTFVGVVLGVVRQAAFENDFSTIELGPAGLIALVRDDGTLLARVPESAGAGMQSTGARARVARSILTALPADGMVKPGVLDGQERVVAVQPLAHFPLAVVVSDSKAWMDQNAWTATLPITAAAVIICCVVALIVFLVVQQIARERAFFENEHLRARTDALTGLPNRLAFTEELSQRLVMPPAPATSAHGAEAGPLERVLPQLALLFIDLDYFKTINDTLGHDVGDALLQAVALRLTATLPAHASVARLGGDEFAVICTPQGDMDAHEIAQRLIAALQQPFTLDQHQILTGCSVGIALAPRDGNDVATLLKCADLALYQAKSEGRGNAQRFHDELSITAQARRDLEIDLDEAWRNRQFSVSYQPIFDAAGGQLAGFEALLRWHHPTRGDVPPEQFIPVIEESGLILKVGNWVLEEACGAAAQWPEHIFISVNVSPAQFRGGRAELEVDQALERSKLAPQRLELEITESLLLQADAPLRRILDRFRARGISLALDDFGTGYSSLRYLRELNINRLKIDQSFIAHIEDDSHIFAVVRAIISLGRALDLDITAEGIETEAQASLLRTEGCTHLQGFLLGPPMSAAAARSLTLAGSRGTDPSAADPHTSHPLGA